MASSRIHSGGDGVPLEVGPVAPLAGFIVDIHPEEQKFTEVVADLLLQVELLKAGLTVCTTAVPQVVILVVEVVTFDEGLANAFADRPSIVTSHFVGPSQRATMRSEAVPQRRPASPSEMR